MGQLSSLFHPIALPLPGLLPFRTHPTERLGLFEEIDDQTTRLVAIATRHLSDFLNKNTGIEVSKAHLLRGYCS